MAVDLLTPRRGAAASREVDDLQDAIARAMSSFNTCPFLRGVLVTNQTFAAGTPLVIDHKLGRTPQGCIVTRSYGANAAPAPVESAAASQPPDLTKQIALQTTAACTFDLWFF